LDKGRVTAEVARPFQFLSQLLDLESEGKFKLSHHRGLQAVCRKRGLVA
jgi:hypothetical protein